MDPDLSQVHRRAIPLGFVSYDTRISSPFEINGRPQAAVNDGLRRGLGMALRDQLIQAALDQGLRRTLSVFVVNELLPLRQLCQHALPRPRAPAPPPTPPHP